MRRVAYVTYPPPYCGGVTVKDGEVMMTYDSKSLDLAEHFLKDHPTESETEYKLLCDALAQVIQDAIEIWLKEQEAKQAPESPENKLP